MKGVGYGELQLACIIYSLGKLPLNFKYQSLGNVNTKAGISCYPNDVERGPNELDLAKLRPGTAEEKDVGGGSQTHDRWQGG